MNRSGPKGNVAALEADADATVRRLLSGRASVVGIMAEYHVAYPTLVKMYHGRTTAAQRRQAEKRCQRRVGRQTGWATGHRPHNKGKKGWQSGGRSATTQFKKGGLRGQAARNYRPVGTITIRYDKPPRHLRERRRKGGGTFQGPARRYIKIADVGRPQDRWVRLAVYHWRQAHGPVAPGLRVVHIDGDTLNDALENLAVMTCAEKAAFQLRRDPVHRERLRAQAGKAARMRHHRNRAARELRGPATTVFDCHACGATAEGKRPPDRCTNCGGTAFEKRQAAQAAQGAA